MDEIIIMTIGMHCTSCEALIDMALEDMDGIESVSSSYETGKVKVRYDQNKVCAKTIKEAIEGEGFKV